MYRSCFVGEADLDDRMLLALAVIFFASTIRYTFGFGEALIAMPLLSMLFHIEVATAWVALISLTVAAAILLKDWRHVQFHSAWRLILSSVAGIPLGLWVLSRVPEQAVKVVLAFVVIAFAIYCMARPSRWKLNSDKSAYLFGFTAGVLGGAYNTQGPPLVIYGTLRNWNAVRFRATLQGFFFPTSVLIVSGHCWYGRLTWRVAELYLLSLPIVVAAVFLGRRLHRRLRDGQFVRYVHLLLILIGISLLVHALRA